MGNCLCKETASTRQESSGAEEDEKTSYSGEFRGEVDDLEVITESWSVVKDNKKHVERLLTTASVDYSSPEIQDIQEAVVELLRRYKDRINERGLFNISHIVPCGSMREKTAVWKAALFHFVKGGWQYLTHTEFDYLAVLEKPCRYEIDIDPRMCCSEVKKSDIDKPCSCEVPNCSRVIRPNKSLEFDRAFREELCKSVESLCDCYCMYLDKQSDRYNLRQKSREQQQQQRGCDKCSVYKPAGQLHIDTEIKGTFPPSSCSLRLMWTSDAMTLVAPEGDITVEIEVISPIKRLPILIDFLPALEEVNTQMNEGGLEHECFLVPKRCRLHYHSYTWRLSGCGKEIDHIANKMSERHRKCYKILKYICDKRKGILFTREVSNYHMKTSVLNHNVTCRDLSEDYRNCVTAVLKELKTAYEREVLKSFCYGFNLLERRPDTKK